MSDIINESTPSLDLPLPNVNNPLEHDVARISESLSMLDSEVSRLRFLISGVTGDTSALENAIEEMQNNILAQVDSKLKIINDTIIPKIDRLEKNAPRYTMYREFRIETWGNDETADGSSTNPFKTLKGIAEYCTREKLFIQSTIDIVFGEGHFYISGSDIDFWDAIRYIGAQGSTYFNRILFKGQGKTKTFIHPTDKYAFVVAHQVCHFYDMTIYGGVISRYSSSIYMQNCRIEQSGSPGYIVCLCEYQSDFCVYNCDLYLNDSLGNMFLSQFNSSILINEGCTVSGTAYASVWAKCNSYIRVNGVLSGSINARKYGVTDTSCIEGRINELPGNLAGELWNNGVLLPW